jgi:hypothetical protein
MFDTGNANPQHLAPQRGDLVMFQNSALLERLSRMRYTTVLIVFLPVIEVAVCFASACLPIFGTVFSKPE